MRSCALVWSFLGLAYGGLLRKSVTQPTLEEYMGFAPEEEPDWQSLLNSTYDNVSTVSIESANIICPTGVQANLQALKARSLQGPVHAPTHPINPKQSYLFVIAPPYTGSTALFSLLATSPGVATLCTAPNTVNCEGQYILWNNGQVPYHNRWAPEFPTDWERAVASYRRYWDMAKPVLVDKSPSNVVKTLHIAEDLERRGHDVNFVVMTRSPCFMQAGHLTGDAATGGYSVLAEAMWQTLQRAKGPTAKSRAVHIRYEDLIDDPYAVSQKLVKFMPQLVSLNPAYNPINEKGGEVLAFKNTDRAKSIVDYMLQYGFVSADHAQVPPVYGEAMKRFGYNVNNNVRKPY